MLRSAPPRGWGRVLACALWAAAPACRSASSAPEAGPAPGAAVVRVEVDSAPLDIAGDPAFIPPDALPAVTTRVRALRAEPDSVRLRVGEAFALSGLRILAVGADGRVIGRYPVYDTRYPNRAVRSERIGSVTAVRPGVDTVRFSAPLWPPGGGPAPAVLVRFAVVP